MANGGNNQHAWQQNKNNNHQPKIPIIKTSKANTNAHMKQHTHTLTHLLSLHRFSPVGHNWFCIAFCVYVAAVVIMLLIDTQTLHNPVCMRLALPLEWRVWCVFCDCVHCECASFCWRFVPVRFPCVYIYRYGENFQWLSWWLMTLLNQLVCRAHNKLEYKTSLRAMACVDAGFLTAFVFCRTAMNYIVLRRR